jgi:chorismate mutase
MRNFVGLLSKKFGLMRDLPMDHLAKTNFLCSFKVCFPLKNRKVGRPSLSPSRKLNYFIIFMNPNLDILPLSDWINCDNKPLIIAGPCSAESEEQLLQTATGLKKLNAVHAIRAGVWKPRTRPNSFEGMGEKALPWIQNVRKEIGLPFCTEIATPQHLELALKYGIDFVWIGARTTVNPFTVQEIADALRGVDIPVLIKNPINPELPLWIGAIERIQRAGVKKIAAIHRGFSTHQPSKYRNLPLWQIAIELKSIFPHLPLIGDPSHIAGKRDLIAELSQKMMDINYDGLIIESHVNPAVAMSDAAQQVTPEVLGTILSDLQIRQAGTQNPEFRNKMEELRNRIDRADREIIEALANRMAIVEEAGEHKRDNNIAIFQVDRWNEVFKTRAEWGQKMNLDKEFISKLYTIIHLESIRKQTEVMHSEGSSNS